MTTETNLPATRDAAQLATGDAGLVHAWLDYLREIEDRKPPTLHAYHLSLDVFGEWLRANATAPGTVTSATIYAFRNDLKDGYTVAAEDGTEKRGPYSAQTINLRLAAVRSFYRWQAMTDRIPANPAADVKGVKRPNSRVHKRDSLSNAEVRDVLDTCDITTREGVRDWAILSLMSYCALRQVEIHRANIGDLKTRADRLTLDVWGKNRDERDEFVVIPMAAERAIRLWLRHRRAMPNHADGDPLFVSLSHRNRGERLGLRAIRGMVKSRFESAGVIGSRKSTHSLRHSAITNAIRGGATPLQVQSMARHSSFDTTLSYIHETNRTDSPAEDMIDYAV